MQASLLADIVEEAKPVYYRPCGEPRAATAARAEGERVRRECDGGSLLYSPGESIEDEAMLFVVRGEALRAVRVKIPSLR